MSTPVYRLIGATLWNLDRALGQQKNKLFNAEAAIMAVADAIEQRYGEDIDRADSGTPNYPRVLQLAVELIRDAYSKLEMAELEPIAQELDARDRAAAEAQADD
jgi:hypothetical protein